MALQDGITQLKIHVAVVFQAHALGFVRRIVEKSPQEPKGLLLVEVPGVHRFRQLHQKARRLVGQNLPGFVEFVLQDADLFGRPERLPQAPERRAKELGQLLSQSFFVCPAFVRQNERRFEPA